MRARGEIATWRRSPAPAIGIITNVAAAHLETLGSIEEVARAKGELFAGARARGDGGLARRRSADRRAGGAGRARRGGSPSASAAATCGSSTSSRRAPGAVVRYAVRGTPVVVRLPLGGAHNARNGAAALAAAAAAGVPPVDAARGLESVTLPPHRSAPRGSRRAHHPRRLLQRQPGVDERGARRWPRPPAGGRRFAILGDMLELGAGAEAAHRELGHAAGRSWPGWPRSASSPRSSSAKRARPG